MSNGIELDGKTKLSSLVARTGVAVEPQNDYQRYYIKYRKELNLYPETTMELEQRNRNSFYSLNSEGLYFKMAQVLHSSRRCWFIVDEFGYTVSKQCDVSNGFAYAGEIILENLTVFYNTQ